MASYICYYLSVKVIKLNSMQQISLSINTHLTQNVHEFVLRVQIYEICVTF